MDLATVCVNDEQLTVCPLTIDVVGRIRFAVAVPTLPSNNFVVPSVFRTRNHDAVPVLPAVPEVIEFAVMTPAEDAPNAVAPNWS